MLAGGLGYLGGSLLLNLFGETLLEIISGGEAAELGEAGFKPHVNLLYAALIGSPLIAALASYLPALIALNQDPAIVLREE